MKMGPSQLGASPGTSGVPLNWSLGCPLGSFQPESVLLIATVSLH